MKDEITKEVQTTIKKTNRLLQATVFLIKLVAIVQPNNKRNSKTVAWIGYFIMMAWASLPFISLMTASLLLFKIFAGITTVMVMSFLTSGAIRSLFRFESEFPAPEMMLHPEMKGAADYQELFNQTIVLHKRTWEDGEKLTFAQALSRVSAKEPELYHSGLKFLRHQRFSPQHKKRRHNPNKPQKPGNEV